MSSAAVPPVMPSQEEADLARAAAGALSLALSAGQSAGQSGDDQTVEITLAAAPRGARGIRVPARAMQLLLQALELTAQGHGVRLLAQHAEMSTGEAADALGISRPHLVLLLERGEIPFHRVGSHRRVRYGDVLAYRARLDAQRQQAQAARSSHS